MTAASDSSSGGSSGSWLFKNKEHGKASAAASLVWLMTFQLQFLGGIFWFGIKIYFDIAGPNSSLGC